MSLTSHERRQPRDQAHRRHRAEREAHADERPLQNGLRPLRDRLVRRRALEPPKAGKVDLSAHTRWWWGKQTQPQDSTHLTHLRPARLAVSRRKGRVHTRGVRTPFPPPPPLLDASPDEHATSPPHPRHASATPRHISATSRLHLGCISQRQTPRLVPTTTPRGTFSYPMLAPLRKAAVSACSDPSGARRIPCLLESTSLLEYTTRESTRPTSGASCASEASA